MIIRDIDKPGNKLVALGKRREQRQPPMIEMRIRPASARSVAGLGACLITAALWAGGLVATVVPIAPKAGAPTAADNGAPFDATTYANGIWQSKVLPAVAQHSVALDVLLGALKADPAAAAKKYGNEIAGQPNFLVHFTGTVTKIDTSSPLGAMTVSVPVNGTTTDVKVDIGPVILGTALRDALPFISFGQFLNQIQYGDVADALNAKIGSDVVSKVDIAKLEGKKLTVAGAFACNSADLSDVTVTPVILKPAAGGSP
jgi:predicted lipoprotein